MIRAYDDSITSCQFSPDGEQLVTASKGKTARIWSSQTGQALLPLRHEAEVASVQFSPDNGLLATISMDQTVRYWEVKDGTAVKTIKLDGYHSDRDSVMLSHDGRFLVASEDSWVRLWDVATGKLERELPGSRDEGLAFSPDGATLATGSSNSAELWRLR